MFRHFMIVVLGMLLIGLMGCEIKTPEIRGVVLDAETKQPVEGAWVRAVIEVYNKTIGGNVHSSLSIDEPHTRTDKQGRFVIPSRSFKKPAFPAGFGTEAVSVGIGASVVDDRGGRVNFKGEKLKEFLGKNKVELTIYSAPVVRTEEEYFSHLQSLYSYCLTGRSSVEIPQVEGGCDAWERDYAIAKHERYLKKYPKTEDTRSHYSIILEQLGLFYEKKGDFEKAITNLKKAKEIRFFRPQDLDNEIRRIQERLQK